MATLPTTHWVGNEEGRTTKLHRVRLYDGRLTMNRTRSAKTTFGIDERGDPRLTIVKIIHGPSILGWQLRTKYYKSIGQVSKMRRLCQTIAPDMPHHVVDVAHFIQILALVTSSLVDDKLVTLPVSSLTNSNVAPGLTFLRLKIVSPVGINSGVIEKIWRTSLITGVREVHMGIRS